MFRIFPIARAFLRTVFGITTFLKCLLCFFLVVGFLCLLACLLVSVFVCCLVAVSLLAHLLFDLLLGWLVVVASLLVSCFLALLLGCVAPWVLGPFFRLETRCLATTTVWTFLPSHLLGWLGFLFASCNPSCLPFDSLCALFADMVYILVLLVVRFLFSFCRMFSTSCFLSNPFFVAHTVYTHIKQILFCHTKKVLQQKKCCLAAEKM